MGHSISGFAFGSAPRFAGLQGALPKIGLLAVKHRDLPLWLLAVRPSAADEPRYPFNDLPYLESELAAEEEQPGDEVADLLAECVSATDNGYASGLVAPALKLALRLNRLLEVDTLCFAANDDGVNFAAMVRDGRLGAFLSLAELGSVVLSDEGIVVRPELVYYDEESKEEAEAIEEDFDALRSLPGVTVSPLKVVPEEEAEPRTIHEAVLRLWPKDWPDAAKSTGIGTWDSFTRFPAAFETVLSRP